MNTSRVQVLDRALDLIELLATSEGGCTIAELSAASQLPKSTIHRILSTYAARHYVEKDRETSTYFLGHKFVEIASIYLNKIILKTEATPLMHKLATRFGATSYLGILENNEVTYLERAEQFNSLRLYTQIGKREPLHCTGLGKVLMAALPEAEFEYIARQLTYERYTPNTITSYEAFREEMEVVRARGYAVDRDERDPDIECVAVPIYDYTRKVMAAMSVSSRGLLDTYTEEEIFAELREASIELSKRMGYTEPPRLGQEK